MSAIQRSIESNRSQEKPSESQQVKTRSPYTEFDLQKAKKRLCDQYGVPKLGYYRSIIELLMNRLNGQFSKYVNMNPQLCYGETVPITDRCVSEQVGCSEKIVGDCRRFCKRSGLWNVIRATGKHGNGRCGVWIYAFVGYMNLLPEQPREVMFEEDEDKVLIVDFEGENPTLCSEVKVPSTRKRSSVYSELSQPVATHSNPDSDRVSEGSEISANKTRLQKQYYSSSIEGEEDKFNKEKRTHYRDRNEPIVQVDSALEKTLVKLSEIRQDSEGNINPIDEAEKPQFRIWLDTYAQRRMKDLSISYQEALEILPVAWAIANRSSLNYRPDTPCYFANGRSNTYAKPLLYDALKTIQSGGEPEQEQEPEMDIDSIILQADDESSLSSEEQEVQMYIRKYRALLIRREGNDGSAIVRVMHNTTAQRLGEETVKRLLKLEGIGG